MLKIHSIYNLCLGLKPKTISKNSPFKVLKKTKKLDISKFKNSEWEVPAGAQRYSIFKVGKKDDPTFEREIIRFYDKDGKMIARCRKGTNWEKQVKNIEYYDEYNPNKVSKYNSHTRRINEKQYCKETDNWKTVREEDQYIYNDYDILSAEGTPSKKIHISKNIYDYTTSEPVIHASLTEYSKNVAIKDRNPVKTFGMDIVLRDNRPEIVGYSEKNNVDVDKTDEFLPYRLLLGKNKQFAATQYFIDKKGLNQVGIAIEMASNKLPNNSGGGFDPKAGSIIHKYVPKYDHPMEISAHEVEHAYQYSLIGRARHNETEYETKCRKILGTDLTALEQKDAAKYYKGKLTYPKLDPNEDLSKNEEYINNNLEVGARYAGRKAMREYNVGRDKLWKIFPYIASTAGL